jgi:lipoprotein-releasing system ATP-binding protein
MTDGAPRPFAVPEHQAPDLRPPILTATSLFKDYRDGSRTITVLRGLDLEIRPGEALAVTGRSGSGKSTLLHLLGLLDRPTAGQIYFRHEEVSSLGEGARNRLRASSLGFVFQAYHLVAELSALQNVLLAARVAAGCSLTLGDGRARARRLLKRVGLGHRTGHRPAKLSGGERQRVAIARALVNEPEVLLADEPTGNLDETTAREVERLLFELAEERRLAMVLVTHEPALAARCSRVLALEDGRLRDAEGPAAAAE